MSTILPRPPVTLENGVAPTLLLWVDEAGPVDLSAGGYTYTTVVRQAGDDVAMSANVTANATPTADRDESVDVPTFTVVATAALASLAIGPATVIVAGSVGGLTTFKHHYPADVIG